jgi:hypothetical protein
MKAGILAGMIFLGGCATPQPNTQGERLVARNVDGLVEVSHGGAAWRKMKVGESIAPGNRVRTAAGSTATLGLLPDGGVLTVHPQSVFEVQRFGRSSAADDVIAVFNLTEGRITGDTLKPAGRTKIVVNTPNGMHEIR